MVLRLALEERGEGVEFVVPTVDMSRVREILLEADPNNTDGVIHTNEHAMAVAKALGVEAFKVGNGEYRPFESGK